MFNFIASLSLLLVLLTGSVFAQEVDQRFCVVPIMASGDGPAGETWRLTNTRFDLNGLPAPVFTPLSISGGPWTISKDRKVVPYKGSFPRSYLDQKQWIREPWSGRLVALTYGGGVSILRPGANQFEEIPGSAGPSGSRFGAITVLPRRHLTIVVERSGTVFVVNGGTLEPWLSDVLSSHGVSGIREFYDSPFLSALIVRDTGGTIHALTDDDKWEDVGSIDKSASGYFVDTPASGVAVFVSPAFVLAIRKKGFGAEASLVSDVLDGHDFVMSRLLGQVFGFHATFLSRGRWQRLSPEGFIDIPGGEFTPVVHNGISLVRDLPTLGRVLLEGPQGLYLYDGEKIEPVKGGGHEAYGDNPRVHDLASIGRVLFVTRHGIAELIKDGELVSRPMPFPTDNTYPATQLVDWPKAGMALAATKLGIFALGSGLN